MASGAALRRYAGDPICDLQSDVSKGRLKAPGKRTIRAWSSAPAEGAFGTFMGVPREGVVASLKDKHNEIAVNFVLEGDVNIPSSP